MMRGRAADSSHHTQAHPVVVRWLFQAGMTGIAAAVKDATIGQEAQCDIALFIAQNLLRWSQARVLLPTGTQLNTKEILYPYACCQELPPCFTT